MICLLANVRSSRALSNSYSEFTLMLFVHWVKFLGHRKYKCCNLLILTSILSVLSCDNTSLNAGLSCVKNFADFIHFELIFELIFNKFNWLFYRKNNLCVQPIKSLLTPLNSVASIEYKHYTNLNICLHLMTLRTRRILSPVRKPRIL